MVILMFMVSIWLLVTSVKNEREAYRILNQSKDYLDESRRLDSLMEFKGAIRDFSFRSALRYSWGIALN